MISLYVGVHIENKNREFIKIDQIDDKQKVFVLKETIAKKLCGNANELEIIYNGIALSDEALLSEVLRCNATVFCFSKTKKYTPYVPAANVQDQTNVKHIQELFQVISNTSISINSRVAILQKILAEYPEFRRNLGAQALIRDSVLFNTLQQPEVATNIAKHYPIICEAAPFIVDTVKKELARNSTLHSVSELATDSTNSSEDDSLGGGNSSSDRLDASTSRTRTESEQIRQISRQQLQAALQQISMGSVNSLSNIAQRNADTDAAAAETSSATSGSSGTSLSHSNSRGRISAEMFRQQLQQALSSTTTTTSAADNDQRMNVSENAAIENSFLDYIDNGSGDIPARYRNHQYVEQLRTMHQMGFHNYELNLNYLNLANGNIENAINLLMAAMN